MSSCRDGQQPSANPNDHGYDPRVSLALREVVSPNDRRISDQLGLNDHMPAVRKALESSELLGVVVVVRRSLVPTLLTDIGASDATVIDIEDAGEEAVEMMTAALKLVPTSEA